MNINKASELFRKSEIREWEDFYCFEEKKKFVVFVPVKFTDKVAGAMAKAGAGLIGNYDNCSFRTEGTGTFRPLKNAAPFSGKKNVLTFEKEIKLEMECDAGCVNKVTDALLKMHPYDEVAYEIHDFKKRKKKKSGKLITLKRSIKHKEMLRRINPDLKETGSTAKNYKRIILTSQDDDETIIDSGKFINADCIITSNKKIIKLIIL